jgi:putative ABC transport system substrate-binding protein
VSPGAPDARSRALVEALEAAGHVEGRNLKLTARWGDDRAERLPGLAGELVQARVDVLVAVTGPALRAARQATSTIPIVGIVGADPAEARLLADLARPGGNVTGVTRQASPSTPVLFELLREVVPRASRLAVLRHTPIPSPMATAWRETQLTARALRVALGSVDVRGPGELEAAFEALVRQKIAALIVAQHPEFLAHRARIAELAAASRLPAGYELREFVEAGGLLSYGPGVADLFRRAAAHVDKLLRGTRPAELPIGTPTSSELVINLTTAKALGLTITPALLLRADQTIE